MSSPRSRACWVRGVLVGVSSALVTTSAHAMAGGGLPQGPALILLTLVCATVGAALGGTRLEGRYVRPLVLVGALGTAQSLGHLALTFAAGHHDHGATSGAAPAMIFAHLAGAVLLGAAINAVEYLYVVCTSVLCWLRLVAMCAQRTAARVVSPVRLHVARQILGRSGLGMRAPPRSAASAA